MIMKPKTDKQILNDYFDINFKGVKKTEYCLYVVSNTIGYPFYKLSVRIDEFKQGIINELKDVPIIGRVFEERI